MQERQLAALVNLIAREVRLAAGGMTQEQLAQRSGLSQPMVSRILSGNVTPTLPSLQRLATAVGHRLSFKLYPEAGIRLRDSGQLAVAEIITSNAHVVWRPSLEMVVGRSPDRRAADLVLSADHEVNMVEIERRPSDFQAQLRAAQLKRQALVERLNRPVNLIVAVPATPSARRMLGPHVALIGSSLPVPSRAAWAAIRAGGQVGGDVLLWVRPRDARTVRPGSAPRGH
jgi:transcriptional regulator with XRE-family HTH domain